MMMMMWPPAAPRGSATGSLGNNKKQGDC